MAQSTSILLSYAFRPFFLLNGLFAIVVVLVWLAALHGYAFSGLPANPLLWHGHEMLIGFVMATVAGFSLTAVATWTGRPAVNGARLGWLVTAWLAGRLAMVLSGLLPGALTAVVDLLFPVMLCIFLGREVIGGRSRRNYGIVVVVALMALLNLAYHMGIGNLLPAMLPAGSDRMALYLLIHLVLLLLTIVAGRIVPNFTANWLRARGQSCQPRSTPLVDRATILATVLAGLSACISLTGPVTGALAITAALLHAFRLSRWCGMATTAEPLLFVLHAAYLWLPIGYLLTACAAFGFMFSPTAAMHALTMGAIGSMILAVTTRVPLGHTGRPLHAARLTVLAYGIFMAAAVVRVLGTLSGGRSLVMIDLSALGWIAGFSIFTWVYWPILTRPRVQ